MLEARPEAMPGRFRVRANQAGFNLFAAPDLVEATLRTGFAAGRGLSTRSLAVFLMCPVAEVPPFTAGNGRSSSKCFAGEK